MNNDKLRFCYNVVSVTSVNKLWFMGVGMGKVDYRGLASTFCRGAPCWWSLQLNSVFNFRAFNRPTYSRCSSRGSLLYVCCEL